MLNGSEKYHCKHTILISAYRKHKVHVYVYLVVLCENLRVNEASWLEASL